MKYSIKRLLVIYIGGSVDIHIYIIITYYASKAKMILILIFFFVCVCLFYYFFIFDPTLLGIYYWVEPISSKCNRVRQFMIIF